MPPERDRAHDYDVMVVGAGGAGLCAALEASRAGARVLVAEMDGDVGGGTRLSGGIIMGAGTRFQRAEGIDDSPVELFHDYVALNRWAVETGCVLTLAHEAGATIEWLADLGMAFSGVVFSGDELKPRGHVVRGGGQALVDVLYRALRQQPGVDVVVRRRVNRLLVADDRVVGAAVDDDEVRARAVIMTTGGFGANTELLARFAPKALRSGDWVYSVLPTSSQGDALLLADQADAQILGHDRVTMLLSPRFGDHLGASLPGWLVIVNALGRRFLDETCPYGLIESLVGPQPAPIFAIFDHAAKCQARPALYPRHAPLHSDWQESVLDDAIARGLVTSHETLDGLAAAIAIPAGSLEATIRRYNDDVATGHDSLYLKDAQRMRPISTPPFYATELRLSGVGPTAAGPRVDVAARVISQRGDPIPGLYAAGECTGGILGDVYVGGGNSLSNCLTFGRIAGRAAVEDMTIVDAQPLTTPDVDTGNQQESLSG